MIQKFLLNAWRKLTCMRCAHPIKQKGVEADFLSIAYPVICPTSKSNLTMLKPRSTK